MQPISGAERVRVLGALLPAHDQPGDQVGWQLAHQPVGDAFVADDGACAVVVNGRFAVVYGEARPTVGTFLYDRIFVGTLQGALAALDPVPCVDGVSGEFTTDSVRVFFETETVRPSAGVDIAPLVCRRPRAEDDAELLASEGAWVAEMWLRPSDATHARALFDSDGGVLGLGTSYAVSPRYAEIAAWIDPLAAGNRIVASLAGPMLSEVLAGGRRISSVVLTTNTDAQRFAEGAGWNPVGRQRVVMFAPPPAGSGRAWQRQQSLLR